MQPDTQTWRTEPRRVYSIDFKLRLVEMATRPDANIADIARAHGVNDNVLFKWVRLWQNEGRVSRRLPPLIPPALPPAALPVEIMPDPAGQEPAQDSLRTTTTCSLTLRHGNITLENPDPEMLLRIVRELAGRSTT